MSFSVRFELCHLVFGSNFDELCHLVFGVELCHLVLCSYLSFSVRIVSFSVRSNLVVELCVILCSARIV